MGQSKQIQGEGNYEAAKKFDQAQTDFAKSGRVEQAAGKARPKTPEEQRELERAEQEGLKHRK